jgi:deoxyribonuclease-4
MDRQSKIWIGAHTSAAGGAHKALYQGQEIGATTIQLFTSNQKQWNGRLITPEAIALWEKALEETGIERIMSHDSYLINLGSSNPELLKKSRQAFREEIERCHALKIPYLNFHPGTAVNSSVEQCLEIIVESLLGMEETVSKGSTQIILETTAGQGNSVGHRFEHLSFIVKEVKSKIPIGVCIDTCHIFAAGYDIRTKPGWEHVLKEFDNLIGLEYLKAFHLNDSLKDLGCRVDRHASLGLGKIGLDSFHFLMTCPTTRPIVKYLETPDGPPSWQKEIALLKEFYCAASY